MNLKTLLKRDLNAARIAIAVCLALVVFLPTQLSFVAVPPGTTGTEDPGAVLVMHKGDRMQMFDSAAGLCLRESGSDNAVCRHMVYAAFGAKTIVARLPYSDWIYRQSLPAAAPAAGR